MRETRLTKGLSTFDAETALQVLYDFVTKSRPNQDKPDYEFIHEMVDKMTDGDDFTEEEIALIRNAYRLRFGD